LRYYDGSMGARQTASPAAMMARVHVEQHFRSVGYRLQHPAKHAARPHFMVTA
jgi:hypothetical protein